MNMDAVILNDALWNLLIRFGVNLGVLTILVFVIYYKYSRKEEYLFSFILMGVMIFLICAVLGSKNVNMGLALGIFAIFAIIRFRTVQFSVKDITYVFIIIGISVVNSQANIPPFIVGAVIVNVSVLLLTLLLEIYMQKKSRSKYTVIYSNLELLKSGHYKELLADLSVQTGQNVEKAIIQKVNLKRGNAELEIYYMDTNQVL
jgi:hypothetical protein